MKKNDDWNTKKFEGHKKNEQRQKGGTTTPPRYLKLLEDGLTRNGVENVCNVDLKHHPIKMGIQSGLNTMDHKLTTISNHHPELIWWQIRNKCIMKLHA